MRRDAIPLLSLVSSIFISAVSLPADPRIVVEPFHSTPWTFSVAPTYALPMYSFDDVSSPAFSRTFGVGVLVRHKLSDGLTLRTQAGWSNAAIAPYSGATAAGSLSEFGLSGGLALGHYFLRALNADLFLDGGGSFGSLTTGSGGVYATARGGAGVDFNTSTGFGARLEGFLDLKAGLYAGPGVSLSVSWNPPASGAAKAGKIRLLEMRSLELSNVFPILRSYYDSHPIGAAVLVNTSSKELTDIRVSFFIKNYMDGPKELALIPRLAPKASIEVPVTALFNEELLKITEPVKVAAELSLAMGNDPAATKMTSVVIEDRTALTWDDNRKAAAFVSSKDPWVLDLVGNINSTVRDSMHGEVPANLQAAMAVHEGLRIYGIGYLFSPARHFAGDGSAAHMVDNVKFPRQTLAFRSGDCADLSVLYASCLEAMGIETAFITVPGHIFMAADLGISPSEAMARGIGGDQVIARDARAWIPIETTLRDKGFIDAWSAAMGEWKGASAKQQADFYPMHESWRLYAPVGLPADSSSVQLPVRDAVLGAFKNELGKLIQAQIASRLAAMPPLSDAKPSAKALNDRGVLYGRYGMLTEAERFFQSAATLSYQPAIINLGNVMFLRGDLKGAYATFKKALAASPQDPRLLANFAKAAAALEKRDEVDKTLESLAKVDPAAAARYSSLTQPQPGGTRAAALTDGSISWF